jgi:outer membrane lipoprotein carrier protein
LKFRFIRVVTGISFVNVGSLSPVLAAFLALMVFSAQANGLNDLAQFIQNQKSGQATFKQEVTGVRPTQGKSAVNPKPRTSSGTFAFSRPNQFVFNYVEPFEQKIIADGKSLWFYDVDLKQVTSQAQSRALANTPAMVIASASSLASLEKVFTLKDAGSEGGLNWVEASPRAKEASQFRSVKVGFKDGQLDTLIVSDKFGQESTMRFSHYQNHARGVRFTFTPPPGVQVLKQ